MEDCPLKGVCKAGSLFCTAEQLEKFKSGTSMSDHLIRMRFCSTYHMLQSHVDTKIIVGLKFVAKETIEILRNADCPGCPLHQKCQEAGAEKYCENIIALLEALA